MTTTLKDISKRAETSEATVSLVLNGRHFNRVSLETRHKIESIAREMGYVPATCCTNPGNGQDA